MSNTFPDANNLPGSVHMLALAENTRKAYRKGWACFADYCQRKEISDPLSASPETVAGFLIAMATERSPKIGQVLSMRTVALYASAITKKYITAGTPSPTHHPTVAATLRVLARIKGTAPRRVMALREDHIGAMIAQCPSATFCTRLSDVATRLFWRLVSQPPCAVPKSVRCVFPTSTSLGQGRESQGECF